MSYQVCHMEKLKRGDVRGILEHLTHDKVSSKNGDIVKARTNYNWDYNRKALDYMPSDSQSRGLWIHNTYKRLNAVLEQRKNKTKALRKDATLVCSFVIGSDHEKMRYQMDTKTRVKYFQACYDFFCERYGKENVLYAVVHNDELTPQLHLGVIPMKDGHLTAKTLFDRNGLRSLQTDLTEKVGKFYGLKRGVEGSDKEHVNEARFKLERTKEALTRVKGEYEKNVKLLDKQKKELESIKQDIGLNKKERYMMDELSYNHSELYLRLQKQFYNSPKGKAFKEFEERENERDDDHEKTL